MKKSVFFIAMLVFGVTSMTAQEYVMFGAKAGVNFATVAGDGVESPESRTGFNVGLLAEIPFSERFSLQPEVLYSAQGFDAMQIDQDNFLDKDQNVEFQVDYIQVPVLAKVYIFDGFSIQAGPSFNFKVNEELDYAPVNDAGDNDTDVVEGFEFGGAAGLAYKFSDAFFVEGRYSYGFSEMIENTDLHNSVFQLGVGFMF